MSQSPSTQKSSLLPRLLMGALGLVLAIGTGYLSLCAWVSSNGLTLPGTVVTDRPGAADLDLSRLTQQQAADAIQTAFADHYGPADLTLSYGEGQTLTLDGNGLLQPDTNTILRSAYDGKATLPFWQLGQRWLSGDEQQVAIPDAVTLSAQGLAQVEDAVEQIAATVDVPPVHASVEVGDTAVKVVRGVDGLAVNREQAREDITRALLSGTPSLTIAPVTDPARQPDLQALYDEVYVAPVTPTADERGNPVGLVVGRTIDQTEASRLLADTADGQPCTIPIHRLHPDLSQVDGLLFLDLLASCETYISGSSGRLANVTLSALACNEVILQPGDVFSFNDVVGQRTTEKGYKGAPAYYAGQTVTEVGGGICQVSSSIYYCAVYSNLDIVTRYNHRYAVGYVPDGLDATVSWGGPEFEFRNDSPYPIKIVTKVDGRNLTVEFYGNNPEGTYVKTERHTLSYTNAKTVYEIDPALPAGQTRQKSDPHSGSRVEVYRCVYDSDGQLLSRTLENTSRYALQNKVIQVSPADAAKYGLAVEPEPTPESAPVEAQP